ncbi:hypothetical protein F66182_14271 [Fusarium sp. NRRL 66182]|nr:hypothetical protein F66182_14271 [Fusarium sp. NRRL 66182]
MVAVYNQRVQEAGISSEKMSAKVGDLLAENVTKDLQGPEYRDLDIIIVSMALHHFSNPQLALKRLADRLQKGGVLWIVEMLEEPHAKDEHERVSPETAQIVHKHGFGVDEMKDLFLGAGLGDTDVKLLDRKFEMTIHGHDLEKTIMFARGSKL